MSYEKLGFVSGQTLKAEHLNYMEEGIANAAKGAAGGAAIIDVIELPTENINDVAFYRLMTAYLVFNQYDQRENDFHCVCVNGLPEVGKPVTTTMSDMFVYYNTLDGEAYGYVTDAIGSQAGVPAGWYTLAMLAPLFDVVWGGVITDIDEDPCDGSFRILLSKDFYIYQNNWCKVPFAYEKAPKIDIQWDGEIGNRIAIDMSMLGYDQGVYFVKVSDNIFTTEELIGWKFKERWNSGSIYETVIDQSFFDTSIYPGAFTINNFIVVVYDDNTLATALGIPTGIYTNGVYFWLSTEDGYVSQLVSPSRITKIDSKYLDIGDVQVDLSNYTTTSQVETMIENAIGSAIRGSY